MGWFSNLAIISNNYLNPIPKVQEKQEKPGRRISFQENLDFLVWSGQTIYEEVRGVLITNISEAKAQLSALIGKVRAGQEVIIGKAGKPVAKLVRYERSEEPRQPGALRGKIKIADDFDELPRDIAEAFGIVN